MASEVISLLLYKNRGIILFKRSFLHTDDVCGTQNQYLNFLFLQKTKFQNTL